MSVSNRDRGQKRVEALRKIYELQGYFVQTNEDFKTGVDVMAFDKQTGKIKKVVECTNYKKYYGPKQVRILPDKFERYVESLNKWDALPDVEKELHVSFDSNLTEEQKKILEQNNIRWISWKHQT